MILRTDSSGVPLLEGQVERCVDALGGAAGEWVALVVVECSQEVAERFEPEGLLE